MLFPLSDSTAHLQPVIALHIHSGSDIDCPCELRLRRTKSSQIGGFFLLFGVLLGLISSRLNDTSVYRFI